MNEQKILTGKGITVAVLDTGAYPHRDFEDRISGFADVVNHRPGPYDDCGHGTHICGIIGGSGAVSDGRYQGMAPGCTLAAVKVLDRKGNGSAAASVAMAFKLCLQAEKSWRRLRGFKKLGLVARDIVFVDGELKEAA